MAVAPEKAPEKAAPERPSAARNAGSVAWDWAKKGLALRESSIIVVIVVSLIYFGVSVPGYFTGSNFKNLLPYFCFLAIMAAGQVFVMTLGEIDLSVGALYLITPFIFWKLTTAGIPLLPSVIIALVIAAALGRCQRLFHRVRRDPVVRRDAGDVVLLRRPRADPVALGADHHAGHVGYGCHEHVCQRVRRRDLFGVDLGACDRGCAAGRAVVYSLGDLHGRDRRQ